MTAQQTFAMLDALEAGDQELAYAILFNSTEDGEYVERARCPYCDQGFEWPGIRDAHMLARHVSELVQVDHLR